MIVLIKNPISETKLTNDKKIKLFKFIAENNEFDNQIYKAYMNSMHYQYPSFPDVSIEKKIVLVVTGCAKLTSETFTSTAESTNLRALLIENNWSKYLSSKAEYPLDDVIREKLLKSSLSIKEKYFVIEDIITSAVVTNSDLARAIADVLVQVDGDISSIDSQVIKSAIQQASTIQTAITLLIKMIPSWDEKTCMEILSGMKEPYCEIAAYGKRPKIKKTILNSRLAKLLNNSNWISSLKEEDDSIHINTFRSADHLTEI